MKDTCKKCSYWTKVGAHYFKCYTKDCPTNKRDNGKSVGFKSQSKKVYFCITNGSNMIIKPLSVDNNSKKILYKVFDAIKDCCIDVNMAICDTMKEVETIEKRWGFEE
jgi:hypothetical protein